jgi:hypothetical protein
MAKKKKPVIDLSDKGLSFQVDDLDARLLSFNPNTMTLLVNFYDNGVKVKSDSSFPFAHLPKPLKSAIKPL